MPNYRQESFNSFLASFTNGAPTNRPTAQSISASASSSSPSTLATAVETIASVSGGQTVFITVTQDPASTAFPTGSESTTNNGANHTSSHTGAIAGGVVGGVAAVAVVAFAFFLVRRRRRASERREATLPPSYADTDMSEHVGGATTAAAVVGAEANDSETAIDEKAGLKDVESDAVQQLDSTMIRPTTELGSEPVGNIAELPVILKDSSATSTFSDEGSSSDSSATAKTHKIGDADNHVMSWAQFNSMGNRNAAARLSQPHGAPDVSNTVWSNMSPTKLKDGEEEANQVQKHVEQEIDERQGDDQTKN
ncbi:hypothetical protein BDV96DRAFT_592604 [Lophiotrema nucula]|uniref:receptor protein-tyrosine kinase n=1 Tax=Lophiotrema nucula TaxID=690887 RepID=A0A6A5YFC1_9PLEO|nr:hypothetical protein BDV96DRAFT_592604 [Lophiotrema nucula]